MARTKADPTAVRPKCPQHPDNRVWLDGFEHCRWSDAHRRPRYRCVTPEGTKGHSFSLPVPVRQPTEHHPGPGAACPTCTRSYARHEGVKTGRGFIFGHEEIARVFLRVGEGMSLREASRELREAVFRCRRHGPTGEPSGEPRGRLPRRLRPGRHRRAPPETWPRVVVLDSVPLLTRGHRPPRSEHSGRGGRSGWATSRRAQYRVALDGTARGARPCLMRVAGAKDAESWKDFFATLEGAPDVVIADLDPAIARAVREAWPGTILLASGHHLAALMRERASLTGCRAVRADDPTPPRAAAAMDRRWGEALDEPPAPRGHARRPARSPRVGGLPRARRAPRVARPARAAGLDPTNEPLIARQWAIAERPRPAAFERCPRGCHRRVAGAATTTGRPLAERPSARSRPGPHGAACPG